MIESILSISFPAAFLAGVVTVFLPCTYPLCLGYLALIAGESSQGRRFRVLITTLWFFLGFGLIYTILGSAAGFFGQFTATTVFLSEIQSTLVIFGGVFFIILGLVLLQVVPLPSVLKGLHSIPFPHWLQPQSWWGALLLGGIFAASWSPCIGPVLGGILLLAASSSSVLLGGALLFSFAFGMMVPLLLLALLLSSLSLRVPRPERFVSVVRFIAGAVFILLGILFLIGDISFLGSIAPPLFLEYYI